MKFTHSTELALVLALVKRCADHSALCASAPEIEIRLETQYESEAVTISLAHDTPTLCRYLDLQIGPNYVMLTSIDYDQGTRKYKSRHECTLGGLEENPHVVEAIWPYVVARFLPTQPA